MTTTATTIRVLWNRYGIEVFAGEHFLGGLTTKRIAQGPEAIAVAMRSILDAVAQHEHDVFSVSEVEEN